MAINFLSEKKITELSEKIEVLSKLKQFNYCIGMSPIGKFAFTATTATETPFAETNIVRARTRI